MTLFDSSLAQLRGRIDSLTDSLDTWVVRAARDLPQHHSQLRRLRSFLEGTVEAVVAGTPLDPDGPGGGSVDDLPQLRRGIGSAHLIWDFFRDKFAQRDMAEFGTHLGAADELAWACYQPFLVGREPPLVFFSTDRTPFAQARTKTLHPPGLDAGDLRFFQAALQRLPVPVIGLPWDIANRLPETVLAGHEAGHVIAEDLGFAAEAKAALAAVGPAWAGWSDEIFADVIGVLATGGAYVEGLMVELAGARDDVRLAAVDPHDAGRYPPAALRVALCSLLLQCLGVTPSDSWQQTYGPVVGDSRDYLDDLPPVAAALLDRPFGGRRLADVLPWDAAREESAARVGLESLDGQPASVAFDVRVWVAASMHAHRRDPGAYAKMQLDRRLAEVIVGRRDQGVRGTPPVVEDEATDDRRAGAALARELGLAGKGDAHDHDR